MYQKMVKENKPSTQTNTLVLIIHLQLFNPEPEEELLTL